MADTYKDAAALRAAFPGAYDAIPDAQINAALARKNGASSDSGSGLAPSTESVLGSLLGLTGIPGASVAGSAIGSAVHELKDSLPKLLKIGVFGPVGSEGVGDAMAAPAKRIARDVAVNAIVNHAPGMAATALTKSGAAATAAGTSAAATTNPWLRGATGAVLDPILSSMGVPHGVAEAAAIAGPPVARGVGKAATAIGERLPSTVMEGLVNAAKRFKPGIEEPPEPTMPADTVRETVNTARGYQADGASPAQAAQRAGWPLGQSEEVPYRAGSGADVAGARGPEQAQANALVRELANLSGGVPAKPLSPIEQFYKENPSARNDIDGVRTTGRFEEGPGGLSDVAAGNVEPHLSPLDALAQLSKAHPVNETALLRRFKDWEVQ